MSLCAGAGCGAENPTCPVSEGVCPPSSDPLRYTEAGEGSVSSCLGVAGGPSIPRGFFLFPGPAWSGTVLILYLLRVENLGPSELGGRHDPVPRYNASRRSAMTTRRLKRNSFQRIGHTIVMAPTHPDHLELSLTIVPTVRILTPLNCPLSHC